jgi:hypothetical protein
MFSLFLSFSLQYQRLFPAHYEREAFQLMFFKLVRAQQRDQINRKRCEEK